MRATTNMIFFINFFLISYNIQITYTYLMNYLFKKLLHSVFFHKYNDDTLWKFNKRYVIHLIFTLFCQPP